MKDKVDINYEKVTDLSSIITKDVEEMDRILQEVYNRMKTLDDIWRGPSKTLVSEGFDKLQTSFEPIKNASLNYSKFLDYVVNRYRSEDGGVEKFMNTNQGNFGA